MTRLHTVPYWSYVLNRHIFEFLSATDVIIHKVYSVLTMLLIWGENVELSWPTNALTGYGTTPTMQVQITLCLMDKFIQLST